MIENERKSVGFTCAYTPLALLEAAGFAPYRILPKDGPPDQAGQILHDNLCPHVKRVLDRAIAGDLPDLAGAVFVNSCDAMRRLADAWEHVRPDDRIIAIDLPPAVDEDAISFFAGELSRLSKVFAQWSGRPVSQDEIGNGVQKYNQLAGFLAEVRELLRNGAIKGGAARMQAFYNAASVEPPDRSIETLKQEIGQAGPPQTRQGVPVFLFGNVMPDPQAFALFESCGAVVAGDDFCTASRVFTAFELDGPGDVFHRLARQVLSKPACARTMDASRPGKIADEVLAGATACGAKGVIGHTLKFCDPYLARVPGIRAALKQAGMPFLFLEGDCTLGSIGQQRTRIEAFIEMMR